MPPPFPGIDPYIESQDRWRDFHTRFNTHCCDALSGRLPEAYEAVLEERFVRLADDHERRAIHPDVGVLRRMGTPPEAEAGGLAVAVAIPPVTIPHRAVDFDPERLVSVEIRRRPDRELVTVSELLSPTNKLPDPGRDQYLARRQELLTAGVHLIELDFLLDGPRLPMARPLSPGDAYSLVSRADHWPDCAVYAWALPSRLPAIPVPLRAPDPDVPLDLAAVYAQTCELGRDARRLNYQAPLTLPLDPATRSWAEARPAAPK